MVPRRRIQEQRVRGYTLVEALVASSVLLIGIAAAASMSLSLVTQEEINERSVKAINYLDNATRLFQLGVEPADIQALLPAEPLVTSLNVTTRDLTVSGVGTITASTLTMSYQPSAATVTNSSSIAEWTGGESGASRSVSVEVIRSDSVLADPLPRHEYVKNNP